MTDRLPKSGKPRKTTDDERTPEEELRAINEQLDRWKVPKRAGIGQQPLTTLGRIRIMRNQAVEIVAAARAERDRVNRLLESEGVGL